MWVSEISRPPLPADCQSPETWLCQVLMKNQYSAFDSSHSISIFWLHFKTKKRQIERCLDFTNKDGEQMFEFSI